MTPAISCLARPRKKRPITIDVLRRIDLKKLVARMNVGAKAASYLADAVFEEGRQPFLAFENEGVYGTDATPVSFSADAT